MGKTRLVPQDVRTRINEIVAECIKKAEAHYGRTIKPFPVRYEVTGACAGVAHHSPSKWYIDINSVLLMENMEESLTRTVPHEVAHMITSIVYPETVAPRQKIITSTGRERREKREVHGPRFYEVCEVIGLLNETRRHNMDVSNAKKKVDTSVYPYECAACHRVYRLTAKRHTMMINGTKKYQCHCKGPIYLQGSLKPVSVGSQTVLIATAPTPPHQGEQGPTGESKLAKCWALYKQYHTRYNRKQMIAVFYHHADCTPAGASTYYAQCQKLWREGYI